ncbi:MAG TPA: hypothetical protein PKH07_14720, partial [bacterium]|nr:hypothetical protein [bacterium]
VQNLIFQTNLLAGECGRQCVQFFSRLERELYLTALIAEKPSTDSSEIRRRCDGIQKEFQLRDVLLIQPSGTIQYTANSPEAIGQPVEGTLFDNTRLAEVWREAMRTGRSLTDFDPSSSTSTGYLAVRGDWENAAVAVAEYNALTFDVALRQCATVQELSDAGDSGIHVSLETREGGTYLSLSSALQAANGQSIVEASESVNLGGVQMILRVRADSSASQALVRSRKILILATAVLIFAACVLAWAMLRSLGMISTGTVQLSPKVQRVQDIAIAASALDPEQHPEVLAFIRQLVRDSVRQADGEKDDPRPKQQNQPEIR